MDFVVKNKALPSEYYLQDVLELGPSLVGKLLVTYVDNSYAAGIISETESYKAPHDRASHAYNMRRTKRNESMYLPGGFSYVYLCYGIHPLFNVVTGEKDLPHAVLIRAIVPVLGLEMMQKRRPKATRAHALGQGPANLTKALGITMRHNGHLLQDRPVWIEDIGLSFDQSQVEKLKRVGIDYAGEDADLLWRYRLPKVLQDTLFNQKEEVLDQLYLCPPRPI